MGGDAKSVQHTVVHPMYVSYTSIPTSTANTTMNSTKLLTKPYLDVTSTATTTTATNTNNSTKANANNYSVALNNKTAHSMHSLITNSNTFSRQNGHCKSNPKRNSFVNMRHDFLPNINGDHHHLHHHCRHLKCGSNDSRFTSTDSDRSSKLAIQSAIKRDVGLIDTHTRPSLRPTNNLNSSYRYAKRPNPIDGSIEYNRHYAANVPIHDRKYATPRRPYDRRDLNTTNYSNEIRDLPPEILYQNYSMKRTRSHDRLVNQQRLSVRKRTRPKSYCSNANYVTPL